MKRAKEERAIRCQICGTTRRSDLRRALLVRPVIVDQIQLETSIWDENGWICLEDLQRFQLKYVQALLEAEKGDLTELDLEVLEGLKQHELLSNNPESFLIVTEPLDNGLRIDSLPLEEVGHS